MQKLDVSLAFLLTFIGLYIGGRFMCLGWPLDHFIHSVSTGSLLLFTFFMISDPKTSPNHPVARIIWAVLIAAFPFISLLSNGNTIQLIWVLVAAAPLVPLLDKIFKAENFQWKNIIY